MAGAVEQEEALTGLYLALSMEPGDAVTLQVLADWYEDQGLSSASACLRWVVAGGRAPFCYHPSAPLRFHFEGWHPGWYWWVTEAELPVWGYPPACQLPRRLWYFLPHRGEYESATFKDYPSVRAAYEGLLVAWSLNGGRF